MISCTIMRSAVVLSAALLAAGVLLLVVAETTSLVLGITHAALALVLAAALVLAYALVIALLPGSARRLAECQH